MMVGPEVTRVRVCLDYGGPRPIRQGGTEKRPGRPAGPALATRPGMGYTPPQGAAAAPRGRAAMSAKHWIGVDLGGTKILAGLFDDDMKLLARAKVATDAAQGPAAVFGRIDQVVEKVKDQAKLGPGSVAGLGLCVPGQINPHNNVVY